MKPVTSVLENGRFCVELDKRTVGSHGYFTLYYNGTGETIQMRRTALLSVKLFKMKKKKKDKVTLT